MISIDFKWFPWISTDSNGIEMERASNRQQFHDADSKSTSQQSNTGAKYVRETQFDCGEYAVGWTKPMRCTISPVARVFVLEVVSGHSFTSFLLRLSVADASYSDASRGKRPAIAQDLRGSAWGGAKGLWLCPSHVLCCLGMCMSVCLCVCAYVTVCKCTCVIWVVKFTIKKIRWKPYY